MGQQCGGPTGSSGGAHSSSTAASAPSVPGSSAFKSVPSSCPNNLAGSGQCSKEVHGPHHSHSHSHGGMHSAMGGPSAQQAAAAAHLQGLCPQYSPPSMDERTAAVMMGLKDGPGHCAPVSAAASSVTHPAFPMSMPMWLQPSQTAYSLSHLQQFLGSEKALAASQYLAAADPFAKAANPFLDLARMGHYPLGKKLFGCPQCRYITDRKNNLKRHISTMHQECDKALECCGVVFKNKASLRDHVLIFHSNGYMCRFCGRNFCRKALLKRHLTVHSGQKDYVCSLCDYATSHKSNLERHKKVHERQSTDSEDNDGSPTKEDVSACTSTTSAFPPAPYNHNNSTPPSSSRSPGPTPSHTAAHSTTAEPPPRYTPTTSLTSRDEEDTHLQLSPIDVDEDQNTLIDVVELAN